MRVIIIIPSIWFLGIGHSNTNSTDSMASTAMLKRARVDDEGEGAGGDRRQVMAISAEGKDQGGMGSRAVVMREVKRTSGLEAPIVSLAGAHQVSWPTFDERSEIKWSGAGRESVVRSLEAGGREVERMEQ